MATLCNGCWNVPVFSVKTFTYQSCCGEFVEIDDLMVLPIQVLARKGYRTLYSCSGHVGVNQTFKAPYIMVSIDQTFGAVSDEIVELLRRPEFMDVSQKEYITLIREQFSATNLGEVLDYFTEKGMVDEPLITYYNANGFRFTIRHQELCMRDIEDEREDYALWMTMNRELFDIINDAPIVSR